MLTVEVHDETMPNVHGKSLILIPKESERVFRELLDRAVGICTVLARFYPTVLKAREKTARIFRNSTSRKRASER